MKYFIKYFRAKNFMKFYITNWDADVVEVGRTVLTVSSTVSYFTMHTINITPISSAVSYLL